MLEPKRSTLSKVPKDVDMTRKFTFRNHKVVNFPNSSLFPKHGWCWHMFPMAKALQEHKMMTVITKPTILDEWRTAVGNGVRLQSVTVCTGTNKMWDDDAQDYRYMQEILQSLPRH